MPVAINRTLRGMFCLSRQSFRAGEEPTEHLTPTPYVLGANCDLACRRNTGMRGVSPGMEFLPRRVPAFGRYLPSRADRPNGNCRGRHCHLRHVSNPVGRRRNASDACRPIGLLPVVALGFTRGKSTNSPKTCHFIAISSPQTARQSLDRASRMR